MASQREYELYDLIYHELNRAAEDIPPRLSLPLSDNLHYWKHLNIYM